MRARLEASALALVAARPSVSLEAARAFIASLPPGADERGKRGRFKHNRRGELKARAARRNRRLHPRAS